MAGAEQVVALSTRWGSWRERLARVPILWRLLLGNSLVLIAGAVAGTLLTRHLASSAEHQLIVVFASAGILASLVVNYWITRSALRPLHDLRLMVDRVHGGPGASRAPLTGDADPDISHLARAVEAMLLRLEQRDLQLRALARRRITAQEEERKRIARGLHDDTAQALSMMIIRLEQLERDLPPDRPSARARAREAGALANHTLEELRALIGGLRPTMLDDLGLGPAIHWYSRVTLAEAGITVRASGLDDALRLPPAIEITLFRIAQEAISNVVRHAGAGVVTVRLSRADGQVCLVLEDDGHGFDVNGVTGQALRLRRFGLLGIHERAELIGARVELDSAPGRGTRLRVCAPLDVPAAWDTPA